VVQRLIQRSAIPFVVFMTHPLVDNRYNIDKIYS
jgi:hypothetical protein